ncbi:hypothetical protein [Streptomyces sp. SAS_270]|uniref:hypothetical protein n=1 Tax=Streptomyces sp. SAS_270 TaxID=3412748 RepID=UPI00403C45D8
MSEPDHEQRAATAAALRAIHATRAGSAAARAAVLSRYVERHATGAEHASGAEAAEGGAEAAAEAVWKAAHAARVAAQALAVLSEGPPDPAADSRCARNAAASAAQASRMARLVDGDTELSEAAFKASLRASRTAATAAAAQHLGTDQELNTEADTAEAAAVTAAEQAGWVRPGEPVPTVSTGVRSPELMSMMHF